MSDKNFPEPSDERRVREVADYYDNLTAEEQAAEEEAAWNNPGAPMIQVPRELVPAVLALIAHYDAIKESVAKAKQAG